MPQWAASAAHNLLTCLCVVVVAKVKSHESYAYIMIKKHLWQANNDCNDDRDNDDDRKALRRRIRVAVGHTVTLLIAARLLKTT